MDVIYPRISVKMITYNQEKVIKRTLESLIRQKDFIYEVCIQDDCSKDKTWEILEDYSLRYPNLIKPYKNEENVGIFQNIEASNEHITGDLVYALAGDDECPNNCFKSIIDYINHNKIDYINESVIILGDSEFVYPDGNRIIHRNDFIHKSDNVLSLKVRGLISLYGSCYSRSILLKSQKLSQGRSYVVEEAQDDQLVVFAERFYYLPVCTYYYYTEYGVSANLSPRIKEERAGMYSYLLEFLSRIGVELNKSDINYLKYRTLYLKYDLNHKKKDLIKAITYYLRSINFEYGIRGMELSRFINHYKRTRLKK